MLKDQDNKCAIYGKPETVMDKRTDKVKALSVDHNHETNKNRGLLCSSCNMKLGLFIIFMIIHDFISFKSFSENRLLISSII